MEDNGIHVFLSKGKWVIIALVILIAVFIVGYLIYKHNMNAKTMKFLEKNNFEEKAEKIYVKINNTETRQTSYLYNFNTNEFSKDIDINNSTSQEYIILKYSNKIVTIIYNYSDLSRCQLKQKGEFKNNKFSCTIEKNNNCKTKCNRMLELTKEFKKEVENDIKQINS